MADLGGGERPSYERYWGLVPEKFIRVDIDPRKHPDIVADLNKILPFDNHTFDHIFLFDVLYIVENSLALFQEIKRVLKPSGVFWVLTPFVFPLIKEPHDYERYTQEGLERLFVEAGFPQVAIEPFGERCSAAANLLTPLLPRFLRLPVYLTAMLLDCFISEKLRKQHPAPMGYFCKAPKLV